MRLRRADGRVYLERWGIEHDRIGGVFVHRMTAPDPGLDLHDHPWNFVSLILSGGYTEEWSTSVDAIPQARWAEHRFFPFSGPRGTKRHRRRFSIARMPITRAHRVLRITNGCSSWSLVIHGPKQRRWGYFMPNGFTPYDEYDHFERRNLTEES